jgi:hypothetical protein
MEAVTWVALFGAAGSSIAVIKFWYERGRESRSATEAVGLLDAKVALLKTELSEYKERVALTYTSKNSLAEAEASFGRQLDQAVQGIYNREGW